MASVLARHWVGRLLMWVVLGTILTGCANATFKGDMSIGSRMGFRPDEPNITALQTDDDGKLKLGKDGKPIPQDPCIQYATFSRYALDLKEAYRTRTTQNRTWIYVAGIMGLGVAAASGALAAATAVAAGTLALLAISGGAAAATFATIDNSQLANVYNMAANQIGTALATAEAQIVRNPADCATPLATLVVAVSEARNTLETARTDSAAGALTRALAGQQAIKDIIAAQQDLTHVTLSGEIVAFIATPTAGTPGGTPTTSGVFLVPGNGRVTLTIKNVPLESVQPKEIKVAFGSKSFDMANPFPTKKGPLEYDVDVLLDPTSPPDGKKDQPLFLVVGPNKQRIPTAAGLKLNYP